jgi:hypothetical protein
MVLCPYIYLMPSPEYPPQRLQPTEVAATHWVPLRALQAPSLRTYEYADVSARLARSELGIKRWFLQAMLSKMMFAAIRLVPSVSTYCSSIPGFIPEGDAPDSGVVGTIKQAVLGPDAGYAQKQPPLLLWGLTLGVISDLLEHLPPHNALELWTYPTFTNWDVRFVMWLMSYRFRKEKSREMSSVADSTCTGVTEEAVDAAGLSKQELPELPEEQEQPGDRSCEDGGSWSGCELYVGRLLSYRSESRGYCSRRPHHSRRSCCSIHLEQVQTMSIVTLPFTHYMIISVLDSKIVFPSNRFIEPINVSIFARHTTISVLFLEKVTVLPTLYTYSYTEIISP